MIRWKLLFINLFLLISVFCLGVYLFHLIKTPYDFEKLSKNLDVESKKSVSEVPKIEKKFKPNTAFFKEIVEKDLFRPDRKEFVEEKKEEDKPEEENVEEPNFIVRGIIIFGKSHKSAIVEKKPSKNNSSGPARGRSQLAADKNATILPKIYKEGDEIEAGWIVKTIYPKRIEFCHGGNCFFVELYKTYEDADYVPPKLPSDLTNRNTEASPGFPNTGQSPDFSAEEFKRLIQRGGRKKP
jgi:hypothetical protein